MPKERVSGKNFDDHAKRRGVTLKVRKYLLAPVIYPEPSDNMEIVFLSGTVKVTFLHMVELARIIFANRTKKITLVDPHTFNWREEFWFD